MHANSFACNVVGLLGCYLRKFAVQECMKYGAVQKASFCRDVSDRFVIRRLLVVFISSMFKQNYVFQIPLEYLFPVQVLVLRSEQEDMSAASASTGKAASPAEVSRCS